MVMELIRATSPSGGFSFNKTARRIPYSDDPLSPTNHCSLFLNNTLNVVNEP